MTLSPSPTAGDLPTVGPSGEELWSGLLTPMHAPPPPNPVNKWCVPPKALLRSLGGWPPAHPFPRLCSGTRPSHPSPTRGHKVSKLRCPPTGSLPSPHSALSLQHPEADSFSAARGSHLTSSLQVSLRRDLVRSGQQDELVPGTGLLPAQGSVHAGSPFLSRWIYEKSASTQGTFPPPRHRSSLSDGSS